MRIGTSGAANGARRLVPALAEGVAAIKELTDGLGARAFLPELIEPAEVFDLHLPLEQAAEGHRAMDQREPIKTLLRP